MVLRNVCHKYIYLPLCRISQQTGYQEYNCWIFIRCLKWHIFPLVWLNIEDLLILITYRCYMFTNEDFQYIESTMIHIDVWFLHTWCQIYFLFKSIIIFSRKVGNIAKLKPNHFIKLSFNTKSIHMYMNESISSMRMRTGVYRLIPIHLFVNI